MYTVPSIPRTETILRENSKMGTIKLWQLTVAGVFAGAAGGYVTSSPTDMISSGGTAIIAGCLIGAIALGLGLIARLIAKTTRT